MKTKQYKSVAFIVEILFSVTTIFSQIRIMPLGESTTQQNNSYRYDLNLLLKSYNINFDFVGNRKTVSSFSFDTDHQGVSGITCDKIVTFITDSASFFPSDIVLLWEGINDTGWHSKKSSTQQLRILIDTICSKMPTADLFVSTIPVRNDLPANPELDAIVVAFNDSIPQVVSDRVALGKKVHFVDTRGLILASDLVDAVHPSAAGYAKMAPAWFNAIRPLLTGIVDVESVDIPNTVYTIQLKSSTRTTLSANVFPTNASNKRVNWASTDPLVAIITYTGKIYPYKVGTTKIIATTKDLSKTDTCVIQVIDGPSGIENLRANKDNFIAFYSIHTNQIHIKINYQIQINEIGLYNSLGQLQKSISLPTFDGQTYKIDAANLVGGLYVVSLQIEGKQLFGKIVIP